MRIGGFHYDTGCGRLTDAAGVAVDLRTHAAAVLSMLVDAGGELVTKDALLDKAWPDVTVSEDSLYQCIAELRRALGPDAGLLKSVPRRGYRLEATGRAPAAGWRRRAMAAAVLALVVVAAAAVWLLRGPGGATAAVDQQASIAVLPFEDLSGGERWTRIGRGLSTEIANELARTAWLYVTAPEATRDLMLGPAEAGRALKVRFVLAGTIQASGGMLRVTSNLTDSHSGKILWSDRWSGAENDIFSVGDQVVSHIGASLASSNTGVVAQADLARAKRKPTDKLDAYDHYLLGVELKHTFDPANYPAAIASLETAVEIDPGFARGWAILALVRGFTADMKNGAEAQAWRAVSTDAATRAYKLDPDDPEVLYNYARVLLYQKKYTAAREVLNRAVEVAPNNADILLIVPWIGAANDMNGKRMLALARRAFELNPKPPPWYYLGLGDAALFAGEYAEAVKALELGPDSDFKFLDLALAQAMLGNVSAAREAGRALQKIAPDESFSSTYGENPIEPAFKARLAEAARVAGVYEVGASGGEAVAGSSD